MRNITVTIVLERTNTGYSAYSPDVLGCIATGPTKKETEQRMVEALEFHFEGLLEDGYELPRSRSVVSKKKITVAPQPA